MRSFLITSTFLMIAAGIYGAFDLSMDIRNGTLIQYDDDSDAQTAEFFSGKKSSISTSNTIHVVQQTEKKKEKPTLLNSFSNLDISDFSRARPPMDYAMMLDDIARPDSLKNEDVAAAINDTLKALSENRSPTTGDSSVTKEKEERKFKLSLYSRGKPRPYRPETAAVVLDTSQVK